MISVSTNPCRKHAHTVLATQFDLQTQCPRAVLSS